MHLGGTEPAELVAVVDLGSTAVRLLLARLTPNTGYHVLAEERVPTRLGGGAPGTLPREAIDETLRAVHRFFARYSPNGRGPRVVAVATSAVRDAANRERLLDPLRRDEGIDVAGPERARRGAARRRRRPREPVVQGRRRRGPRRRAASSSAGCGAARSSRQRACRSARSGPRAALSATIRPRRASFERSAARSARSFMVGLPPAARGEIMVGLGGTVRALASIHLRAHSERTRRHGLRLHQSDVTAVRERLEALAERKRRKIRGLKAERVDIILAGAIVIEEVMVFGGYLTLTVCTRGVRDGRSPAGDLSTAEAE